MRHVWQALVRRFAVLLRSTLPGGSIWRRVLLPVPPERFGSGLELPFPQFFQGQSRVSVRSLSDLTRWLSGCSYARDIDLYRRPDYWQHPCRFERIRRGDCEDYALWAWRKLVELGYEAELVAGRCCSLRHENAGHVWVIFRHDNQSYLLDPVLGRAEEMIRPLSSVAAAYVPEVSVDGAFRQYVYGGYLAQHGAPVSNLTGS